MIPLRPTKLRPELLHAGRRPSGVRRGHRAAVLLAAALVLAACGGDDDQGLGSGDAMSSDEDGGMSQGMGGDMDVDAPRVPPVFGYYDGDMIFFIHTEASDADLASALEGMMGSPVPVVESLADVSDEALGDVYVFTNGVKPDDTPLGPLNFQPDVFDSAPGDSDYTPLRRVVEVTWVNEDDAQVLTNAEDIEAAESDGKITTEPTEAVINAPFLTWPDGMR